HCLVVLAGQQQADQVLPDGGALLRAAKQVVKPGAELVDRLGGRHGRFARRGHRSTACPSFAEPQQARSPACRTFRATVDHPATTCPLTYSCPGGQNRQRQRTSGSSQERLTAWAQAQRLAAGSSPLLSGRRPPVLGAPHGLLGTSLVEQERAKAAG